MEPRAIPREGPRDKGKLCWLGLQRAPRPWLNKGFPHWGGGGGAPRSDAETASPASGGIPGCSQRPCDCDLAGGLEVRMTLMILTFEDLGHSDLQVIMPAACVKLGLGLPACTLPGQGAHPHQEAAPSSDGQGGSALPAETDRPARRLHPRASFVLLSPRGACGHEHGHGRNTPPDGDSAPV